VRFVGMAPGWSLVTVAAFGYGAYQLRWLKCGPDLAMRLDGASGVCLNGSIAYVPALAAMIVIGGYLRVRGHPAAFGILSAGAVFAVSLTLRTLDPALCNETVVAGTRIGTQRRVKLHTLPRYTLAISNIETDNPHVKASVEQNEDPTVTHIEHLQVRLEGDPPAGRHHAVLTVNCGVPGAERFEIPVTIVVP